MCSLKNNLNVLLLRHKLFIKPHPPKILAHHDYKSTEEADVKIKRKNKVEHIQFMYQKITQKYVDN